MNRTQTYASEKNRNCYEPSDENLPLKERLTFIAEVRDQIQESKVTLKPAPSPVDIPLKLCQEKKKNKPSRIPVLCKPRKVEKCSCTTSTQTETKKCVKKLLKSAQTYECRCVSQFKSTPFLDDDKTNTPLHTKFKSTSVLDDHNKNKCRCCSKNTKSTKQLQSVFVENSSHVAALEATKGQQRKSKRDNLRSTTNTTVCSQKPKINSLGRLVSLNTGTDKKSQQNPLKAKFKSMSLLDRSCLSQKEYMDLLSTPNIPPVSKSSKTKPNKCFRLEPCPARIIQMAIPNKRYVLANWQSYQHLLPAEMLTRFDKILHSGNNELEPSDARRYFKQRKKKEEGKKKKKKRKKSRHKCCWLEKSVEDLVSAIFNYFDDEPLYMLNFKEMMLSNQILAWLGDKRVADIKNRSTKNVYKRTIIEICDKLVTWIEKLNVSIDLKPLNSLEELEVAKDLPSLMFEEVEEEIEEISDEEEEGDEEEEERREEEGGQEEDEFEDEQEESLEMTDEEEDWIENLLFMKDSAEFEESEDELETLLNDSVKRIINEEGDGEEEESYLDAVDNF